MNLIESANFVLLNGNQTQGPSKIFYGHILNQCDRKISKTFKGIAGIYWSGTKPTILINEDNFRNFPIEVRASILEHEVLHFINQHIFVKSKQEKKDNILVNISMDLAINQAIPFFVEAAEFVNLTTVKAQLPAKYHEYLIPDQAWRYYYSIFEAFTDELKDKFKEAMQDMQFDSHEEFGEGTDLDSGKVGMFEQATMQQIIGEAVKKSGGIGKVPGSCFLAIQEILAAKVDWKRELRRFTSRSLWIDKKKTRAKLNRRTGVINPGRKKDEMLNLVVGVDTSGSMCDATLIQVYGELFAISKYAKITVLEWDHGLRNEYEFNPKKIPEFKGRGGTDPTEALERITKLAPDAYIMITDGQFNDAIALPRVPAMWVVCQGGIVPSNWGKVIELPTDLGKAA